MHQSSFEGIHLLPMRLGYFYKQSPMEDVGFRVMDFDLWMNIQAYISS